MADVIEKSGGLYPCIGGATHHFFDAKQYYNEGGDADGGYWAHCDQCGSVLEFPSHEGARPMILVPKVKR